MMYDRLMI